MTGDSGDSKTEIAIGDWVARFNYFSTKDIWKRVSSKHKVETIVSHSGKNGVVTRCGKWMRLVAKLGELRISDASEHGKCHLCTGEPVLGGLRVHN